MWTGSNHTLTREGRDLEVPRSAMCASAWAGGGEPSRPQTPSALGVTLPAVGEGTSTGRMQSPTAEGGTGSEISKLESSQKCHFSATVVHTVYFTWPRFVDAFGALGNAGDFIAVENDHQNKGFHIGDAATKN